MFKKTILTLFASLYVIASTISNEQLNLKYQMPDNIDQKEIKTKKDYKDLEETLYKLIDNGFTQGYFYLGLLYENNFHTKDGIIKMDLKKAKQAFKKALEFGYGLAGYHLAMIKLYNGKPNEAIGILEKSLKTENKDTNAYNVLATQYAAIILDNFYYNKELLSKAKSYLRPILSDKMPTIEYLYAHILNILNDKNANYWLNKACKSPYADKKLRQRCMSDQNIEIIRNSCNIN